MKDKEERIARAVAYFKEGYNCSQSVVAAFADLYGFTHEQALHISASFGGGYAAHLRSGLRHVPVGGIGSGSHGRQRP